MAARPIERLRRVSPQAWDTLLACAVFLASAVTVGVGRDEGPAPAFVRYAIVAAACAPLAFRRRWPIGVLAATGAATAVYAIVSSGSPTELALIIVAYSAASLVDRRTFSRVALPLATTAALVDQVAQQRHGNWVEVVVGVTFTVLLPMLLGRITYNRRVRIAADRTRAAEDAVATERARIARELHDVVAHAMAVMVVQAGAARTIVDRDPDGAKAAMGEVEATGRTGLIEMRRLIGVLTADDGEAERMPQPGLAHLDELLRTVRAAGVPVELLRVGDERPLAAGADVNAYRVIQEALTNTLKHAGNAHASVTLAYDEDALEVEIADDGVGPRQDGPPGHGLIGMRERVGVFGGTFDAGPRAGGGFVVRARFPTGDEPA
jgi:signal transduction histidine kinase